MRDEARMRARVQMQNRALRRVRASRVRRRLLFAIYNRPSISVRVISAAFGMDGRGGLC